MNYHYIIDEDGILSPTAHRIYQYGQTIETTGTDITDAIPLLVPEIEAGTFVLENMEEPE